MLKPLVKDMSIYGLSDFILKFFSFALFPIYTHYFSVEDYGIMGLVMSFSAIVITIINLGMNNSVQRFYWDPASNDEDRPLIVSTGLWILLFWSILITAVCFLGTLSINDIIYRNYQIPFIFIAIALITNVPAQMIQFSQDVLRLHFSPWRFTVVAMFRNFIGTILGLVLIIGLKKGLAGVFWGNFLAISVSVPFAIYFIKKDIVFKFDRKKASELVAYGYPFIFTNIAYWIFGSLDRWMLGTICDNVQVGLYNIAYQFTQIIVMLLAAFGQAWSPYSIKLYRDNPQYKIVYSKILTYLYLVLTATGLLVGMFGYEFLRFLTPETYWPASSLISVLSMGVVLSGTIQLTAVGISLEKKTRLLSIGAWLTAVLNLLLNLILIPYFGAMGAAFATLFAYAFFTSFCMFWTQKLHPIPIEWPKIIKITIIFIATIFFSIVLNNSLKWDWYILVAKILYCLVVSLLLFSLKIISIEQLKNMVHSYKS